MSDQLRVRIVSVSGYRPGEEVFLPRNRALTYACNGQAEPIGWDPHEDSVAPSPAAAAPSRPRRAKALNRMLETGPDPDSDG